MSLSLPRLSRSLLSASAALSRWAHHTQETTGYEPLELVTWLGARNLAVQVAGRGAAGSRTLAMRYNRGDQAQGCLMEARVAPLTLAIFSEDFSLFNQISSALTSLSLFDQISSSLTLSLFTTKRAGGEASSRRRGRGLPSPSSCQALRAALHPGP